MSRWDERYAQPGYAYGTDPNAFLAEVADRVPPGPVGPSATSKRRSRSLLPALFPLLAVACSAPAPSAPAAAGAVLGPAGGELTFLDGAVRLHAVPGQLSGDTRFGVAPSTGHPGSELLVPGSALRLAADPATAVELQVTLHVPVGALPPSVRAAELRLYRLEGTFWRQVEGSGPGAGPTVSGHLTLPATVAAMGVAPATVEVLPAQVRMLPGEERTLTAVVRDAGGAELPLRPVLWTTSKRTVAVVDDAGRVRAVAPGIAHIGATAGSAAGSNSVVVEGG